MPFTVDDIHDLLRLLAAHPEWRAELRQHLLTEELLTLPQLVRQLAQAQARTDERLARLEEAVTRLIEAQRRTDERLGELAEAQRRTDERLGRVEERVAALIEAQRLTEVRLAELAEAQRRTDERLAELAEAQRRTEAQLADLTRTVHRLIDTVGDMRGRLLELQYRDRVGTFFGRYLRRARAVEWPALEDALEAHLSPEELDDLLQLDLLVSGRPRRQPEIPEVWLAVEVSAVVDRTDVERARRGAALLARAGYRAVPVVAGERATLGAQEAARRHAVALLQDGRSSYWEEALAAWTGRAETAQ